MQFFMQWDLVGDEVGRQATKGTMNQLTKVGPSAGAALFSPVGIAADIAQLGFKIAGMPRPGKLVGASGNMLSGAIAGGAAGGPFGAVVGAAVSISMWAIGESCGHVVGRVIENFGNYA